MHPIRLVSHQYSVQRLWLPSSTSTPSIACNMGYMEPRRILPFLMFFLLVPCAAVATQPPQSAQPEVIATPQGTPEATVSTNSHDAYSLLVPDGTRLLVKVVNEFSSSDAKVGDVIDLVVVFAVRVDGITVIPKGTALAA